MSSELSGGVAVITGAASGIGLATARAAAQRGMRVVMADLRAEALSDAARGVAEGGAEVLTHALDVSDAAAVDALAAFTFERFGVPQLVFNNAGVAAGGLAWENTARDWAWVFGVNVMGVAHGVRAFTPRMLQHAAAQPGWHGHIVNTASMAGLVAAPTMGVYNASKHAVVGLTETLHHDLALVTEQVHAHLLCPFFVPTGISDSERARPEQWRDAAAALTPSQQFAKAMSVKAVSSGKVSADELAGKLFEALAERRFFIFSHPKHLTGLQVRTEDTLALRNPRDPYFERPELTAQLRAALRGQAG